MSPLPNLIDHGLVERMKDWHPHRFFPTRHLEIWNQKIGKNFERSWEQG